MKVMKIVDINGMVRECDSIKLDTNFPGYLKVDYLSKRHPDQRLSDWYPVEDFKRLNPTLSDLALNAPLAEDVTGIVTSSTEATLQDKTQSWKINEYKGYNVWISRGLGEGQTRVVVKNSKHTLTADKPWDVKPDKTSQYVISLNTYFPPANNNILPIFEHPTNDNEE